MMTLNRIPVANAGCGRNYQRHRPIVREAVTIGALDTVTTDSLPAV